MTTPTTLYIGWDVGGWNCDNSSASRDALVVLQLHPVEQHGGQPQSSEAAVVVDLGRHLCGVDPGLGDPTTDLERACGDVCVLE